MALNEWWAGDSTERYWLEITNRSDIGANLLAPQRDDAAREYWSYTLVSHVRPGDLVFHWDKNSGPAIIGFSIVAGTPKASRIKWQSRGTYGRTHAPSGWEAAWEAPLGAYVELRTPVTQERLRELEKDVERVRDDLTDEGHGPLYFPFALSDKRPLRAAQGYLTKFPRALVEAIPELQEARDLGNDAPDQDESPSHRRNSNKASEPSTKKASTGRLKDSARKKAIEMHAVDTVMAMWEARGWAVEDVGLYKPWDITATKSSHSGIDDEFHIEVKGSSGTRDAIDLTDGEVRHAEDTGMAILVVVDQILVAGDNTCSGGRVRIWEDWTPERDVLVPTAYRYPLPEPTE